jgi:hypothetical protein
MRVILIAALGVLNYRAIHAFRGVRVSSVTPSRNNLRSLLMSASDNEKEGATSTPIEGASMDRKELWKEVSRLEKEAVDLLSQSTSSSSSTINDKVYLLLTQSQALKAKDPFIQLTQAYTTASEVNNAEECSRILLAMRNTGVPPHLTQLSKRGVSSSAVKTGVTGLAMTGSDIEEVDISTTFSDTTTG